MIGRPKKSKKLQIDAMTASRAFHVPQSITPAYPSQVSKAKIVMALGPLPLHRRLLAPAARDKQARKEDRAQTPSHPPLLI